MQNRTDKIQEIAKRLLDERKVDLVLGHKKGTIPLKNTPGFAYNKDEVKQLLWDGNCRSNLATFLPRLKGKRIAVVAQGCVSRNIVGLIIEKQIPRENLYIIGVPCIGMLDPNIIRENAPGEILETKEDETTIVLKGNGFEISLKREDVLRENCQLCLHRNPTLFDELVANEVKEQDVSGRYDDITALENKTSEERTTYFDELLSSCIRCYACRDACPLCYCPVCFVDESNPQWCGKSTDPRDVLNYHILRAFHCAGRCTECGACEDACPMDIKVRMLTRKIEKDIQENYGGYEAGMSLDAEPPLATFKLNDPQSFIK